MVIAVRMLRALPADSIKSWRRALDRIAATSKRGNASVALRRQLLDAIDAPSTTLFRERLRQLPVSISSVPGRSGGVDGHHRTYSVQGVTRVTLFFPTRTVADEDGENRSAEDMSDGSSALLEGEGDMMASTASHDMEKRTASYAASDTFCEYNSPESGYLSGECATQQEIDDAALTIAVLDQEIQMQNADVVAEGGCDAFNESCGEPTRDSENDNASALDFTELSMLADAGENDSALGWDVMTFQGFPCESAALDSGANALRGATEIGSCADAAAQAVIGVGAWVGAKVAAYYVMTAAVPPPAAAVGWAIFGAMTTGWAAGSAISSYYTCRRSNTNAS